MRKILGIFVTVICLFLLGSLVPTHEASAKAATSQQLIIINKKTNQLAYYDKGNLTKVLMVGTGRQSSYTPEGKFKIVNKIVNRPYYKGNIPGGSPKNPLGNRWLGLNARGTWGTTYAIHGNNNPATIGRYVSAGCVRMYNNQVQWLFNRVAINTPVIITTTNKSFNAIAAANGFKVTGDVDVSYPAVKTTMKKGSKGESVTILQLRLKELGFNNTVDGIFGSGTEQALKKFQTSKNIKADGIASIPTLNALGLKY
ncbi:MULTISPECIES: L,D-transpeptidase family protein [Bacillus]|uniref:L,D-transpeptidase family protein n=1 Tax=Bacillus TaxID=1386 RepID=UPI000300C488|nr:MULTISPECIES: L,D-transpeptidase family protein [Bacillus]